MCERADEVQGDKARKRLAELPGEKRIVTEMGHQAGLDGSLPLHGGSIIFPLPLGFKIYLMHFLAIVK